MSALSQFFHAQLELKATLRQHADLEDLSEDEVSDALNVSYSTALTIREYERIRLRGHGDVLFRGPFDATYDLPVCSIATQRCDQSCHARASYCATNCTT